MNSSYRSILFTIIALLIVAAVGLFVFREPILEAGTPSVNLTEWAANLAVTPDSGVSAETLSAPVLGSLVNYSPSFDFDRICWRPETGVVRETCRLGNGQPFSSDNSE